MEAAAASTEIRILGWSAALLLGHILVQALSLDLSPDMSVRYLLGPRDAGQQPKSAIAGRLLRSLGNMLETYPAFVALALALAACGRTGGLGAVGATVWIVARIAYLGLYLGGVPVLRSLAWLVSIAGLLLMLLWLMVP